VRLLAWIEPTADGRFKTMIVQSRTGVGGCLALPSGQEFPSFAEARDWVEGKSIASGWEIRWMSA
jgi:hypothetical protein